MSERQLIIQRTVRQLVIQRRGAQGPAGTSSTSFSLGSITQSGATTGQVAQWNGTNWVPATISGTGTVTSVNGVGGTTGLSFTGGPITGAGELTLTGTLAVGHGGTGATTPAGARAAIGLGTSDKPSFAGLILSYSGSTWSLEITGVDGAGNPLVDWIKQ